VHAKKCNQDLNRFKRVIANAKEILRRKEALKMSHHFIHNTLPLYNENRRQKMGLSPLKPATLPVVPAESKSLSQPKAKKLLFSKGR
jgi:hypothetical protein